MEFVSQIEIKFNDATSKKGRIVVFSNLLQQFDNRLQQLYFESHLAVSVEEVAPALHLVAAAGDPLDGAAHPELEAVSAPPRAHTGLARGARSADRVYKA